MSHKNVCPKLRILTIETYLIAFTLCAVVNILNVGVLCMLTVSAVERHLVAITADLEAAKKSMIEWQTRFEELSTAQNPTDHDTAFLTLRQELEEAHRADLGKLANSC